MLVIMCCRVDVIGRSRVVLGILVPQFNVLPLRLGRQLLHLLLLLLNVLVVFVDDRAGVVVRARPQVRERVRARALLNRARWIVEAVHLVSASVLRLWLLGQLFQLIFKFFNISVVLTLMPLLIAVCVLEQICVFVEVVFREWPLRFYLIVVLS